MNKGSKQEKAREEQAGQRKLEAVERPEGATPFSLQGSPTRCPRNRLISKMLQNRSVLRIICAPRGYGRTSLAREYARRMFPGKHVEWVDASLPSFLADLDRGRLQGFNELVMEQPSLIVFDDVPWLHEQRAATLSRRIDAALYRGIEVIAIALPSCDCLAALQSERIFISAVDLELTEEDCFETQQNQEPHGRARASRMWNRARSAPLGRVPAVAWGDAEAMRAKVLEWFFSERLPSGILRTAFSIVLIGSGRLSDLARVGADLQDEDARMIERDYPFLCIDLEQGRFSFPRCDFEELRRSMEAAGVAGLFGSNAGAFMGRLLAVLMERDDLSRVEEVLGVFCTDEQCGRWLLDSGWELVDRGEVELADALIARCPDLLLESSPALNVLHAWVSGLMGDERESLYFAQRVLGGRVAEAPEEDEELQGIYALAYLALAAFGETGASIYGKDEFSSDCAPVTVSGFVARTVDLCSEEEITRAFAGRGRDGEPKGARDAADPARARALSALFTGSADRFRDAAFYRLAFHLLCFVDSEELKPVVRGIGCDIVVHARRSHALTCSEALVTRDLWRTGFFGVMGSCKDKHDAKLLEDAGRVIRRAAALRGEDRAEVPWDIESRFLRPVEAQGRPDLKKDEIPLVHVRLFGSFEVTVGDRYVKETEWRGKKSRLLLVLVVLGQGRDVSRDELFEELWPGMSRVRALDNFYSVWSNACAILGDGPYLERAGSFCRVNPRYLISDVAEFEQLTRRLLTEHPDTRTLLDIYARIESLYRGGLVPSETDNNVINAQRERYEANYVDAMISAADCSLRANDARLALWFARKAKEVEAKREDVYQVLIRAQIAAGQRCSAIKSYFECREYLREELGLDPSAEVQELYSKLINVDPTLLQLDPSTFRRH